MSSIQQLAAHSPVVLGVDTHKHICVVVDFDDLGAVLEARSFAADSGCYAQLLDVAAGMGARSPSRSMAPAPTARG